MRAQFRKKISTFGNLGSGPSHPRCEQHFRRNENLRTLLSLTTGRYRPGSSFGRRLHLDGSSGSRGLDLEDLIVWNSKLLASGANIQDINTIRILLSSIKGGGLLSKILPSKSITLILSDVLGNDLSKVASGPTIHSTIERKSIFRIFKQYNLSIEPKIKAVLRKKTKLDPDLFGVIFASKFVLNKF